MRGIARRLVAAFSSAPTRTDVGVLAGAALALAGLKMWWSLQEATSEGVAPGHVPRILAAVVVSGVTLASFGLLATLAAVDAGWTRRRIVGAIGFMAALTVVGRAWLSPLIAIERGSPVDSAGFDLLLAAMGHGDPSAAAYARYQLARAFSPLIGWALLPFFATSPRPRWPWWSLAVIVPLGAAWYTAAGRWIRQPLFGDSVVKATLAGALVYFLPWIALALLGRELARRGSATSGEVVRPAPAGGRRLWPVLAGAVGLAVIATGALRILYPPLPASPAPPATGSAAPDFDLVSIDGARVRLSELRGKVVVVNFFGTGCGPCRRELPVLDALARELGPRGLVVLPVTTREKREDVIAGLAELRVSLPALLDPEGMSREWGVSGIPSTFMVDRRGVVRAHHVGYGAGLDDTLRTELVALLEAPGP